MQNQSTELARDRVCQTLLDRIIVMDKMIEEAELHDNLTKIRQIYLLQNKTLNRLERVVAT